MSTKPNVICIVVLTLSLTVFLGMAGVFFLILSKCDPALIAVLAAFPTTALGGVTAILNNTRTPGGNGDATEVIPAQIVNTSANPVPTQDQP